MNTDFLFHTKWTKRDMNFKKGRVKFLDNVKCTNNAMNIKYGVLVSGIGMKIILTQNGPQKTKGPSMTTIHIKVIHYLKLHQYSGHLVIIPDDLFGFFSLLKNMKILYQTHIKDVGHYIDGVSMNQIN